VLKAIGMGDIVMELIGNNKNGLLRNVLYIPDLHHNLFSVSKFTADDSSIMFDPNVVYMVKNNIKYQIGKKVGKGLYQLLMKPTNTSDIQVNLCKLERKNTNLWHQRLGHISENGLKQLIQNNLSSGIELKNNFQLQFCEACAMGKQTRTQFQKFTTFKSNDVLEVIHSDVCGPMQTVENGVSFNNVNHINQCMLHVLCLYIILGL